MGGKGSGKKKVETCKTKITKYKVSINAQSREFRDQENARRWAIKLLEAPVFFIEMESIEVEEEGC